MGDTFDYFSEKTSFNPDDRLIGFDSTFLGGEKKWTYRTLITSISSQMVNSGACVDTGLRAITGNWESNYLNQSNYFPVSGGTVTGNTTFNNDVTILGNLSASNNLTVNGTISAKGLIYSQDGGVIKPLSGTGGIVVNDNFTNVTVISAQGGSIGGSGNWVLKSSAYTAANNDKILADTSSGEFTITLPPSPNLGDNITIVDIKTYWGVNNLIIDRNGSTIEGSAENATFDLNTDSIINIIYNGVTWKIYL